MSCIKHLEKLCDLSYVYVKWNMASFESLLAAYPISKTDLLA